MPLVRQELPCQRAECNTCHMNSRSAGVRGWSFSILLLVSAGTVSVPNGGELMSTIRVFYENNVGLIVPRSC